jgi:LAO/AO transport system kinase
VMEIEMMLDLGHMGEAGINRWQVDDAPLNSGALKRLDRTSHHSADELAEVQGLTNAARHAAERHGTANPGDTSWRPPVLKTVAKDSQGIDDLVARLNEHYQFLAETGRIERLRAAEAKSKLRERVSLEAARIILERAEAAGDLQRLTDQLARREVDPLTAVEVILAKHLR